MLPGPAQRVRKTWNRVSAGMKRQTHIIWQAGSRGALLLSMAGRQNGSFQPARYWQKSHEIIREEPYWGVWLARALLLIWNNLFCFHGDGRGGMQWSGAECTSCPKNVRSTCLLGQSRQSRGCSLPHPRVMGQVLVSAPSGCNRKFKWMF